MIQIILVTILLGQVIKPLPPPPPVCDAYCQRLAGSGGAGPF